ncbi:MAG TPA: ATP-binding protein [Burkholderiales bacterium]|nr:ATP-binding protein [Burkholderiales bacterium]
MKSIRRTLVLWLVGGLAVGSLAVLAGTYALTRSQIGRMFDEELRQVALAVQVREDLWGQRRVRIARPGFSLSVRAYDATGRTYFETLMPSLPSDTPFVFVEGLSHAETAEGRWRLYTHVTSDGIVQVGQPTATRDALARELSLPILMPMLMLIPLLAALIAWALRRGLAPLQDASRSVSDRDVSRLDPLPTDGVPRELLPLVEQINALLARLANSLDAQRRFLADAAHELRSPVSALALQAQLAQRAPSPHARSEALEELRRGTERARRLIQQLLDFARLDPGVQPGPMVPIDVAKVVREAVGTYAQRADELVVDLGADAAGSAYVSGNEAELQSLVANLVDNALRYAPPGTAVTAAVKENADMVEISVVDSGPGIPPEERERVFRRFHRLAGDTTSGTGLGLAIVGSIVERHHGTIRLEDAQPGAMPPGLAVHVALPVLDTHRTPLQRKLQLEHS